MGSRTTSEGTWIRAPTPTLTGIPNELLLMILHHLDDLRPLLRVCQHLRCRVLPLIWKHLEIGKPKSLERFIALPHLAPLVECLVLPRWRGIELLGDTKYEIAAQLRVTLKKMTRLRHLQIEESIYDGIIPILLLGLANDAAPRIRKFHYLSPHRNLSSLGHFLRTQTNITTLSLGYAAAAASEHIMPYFPNLERFEGSTSMALTLCRHPTLHTLRILALNEGTRVQGPSDLPWPGYSAPLLNIRNLDLPVSRLHPSEISTIHLCFPRIETLTLRVFLPKGSPRNSDLRVLCTKDWTVALSMLSGLRSLSIRGLCPRGHRPFDMPKQEVIQHWHSICPLLAHFSIRWLAARDMPNMFEEFEDYLSSSQAHEEVWNLDTDHWFKQTSPYGSHTLFTPDMTFRV